MGTMLPVVPVPVDLARRLRSVARRHRELERERDRLVVEARQAGGSLREVGELIGLTHAAVRKIEARTRPIRGPIADVDSGQMPDVPSDLRPRHDSNVRPAD